MKNKSIIAWLLTAVALGVFVVLGRTVTLDEDIARLLPDHDPALVRITDTLRGLLDRTLIDVGSERDVPADVLSQAADQVVAELRRSGTVRGIQAELNSADAVATVDFLREHAAVLFTPDDYDAFSALLEPAAIVSAVETLARRIQEPDGAYLAALAPRDPLRLTDRALAPLASLLGGLEGARLIDGRLCTPDGRHQLLIVDVGFPTTEPERTRAFVDALERVVTDVEREFADFGIRVRSVGGHRSTLDNARQVERDVLRTSTVGIAVVLLLAGLCVGRLWWTLLAVLPASFGAGFALGVTALSSGTVAAPVIGFGAVLMGLSIDFAIHVLFRRKHAQPLPLRAILMGATTTSVAFFILQTSAVPGIREIGRFGGFGILAAAFFATVLLPHMLGSGIERVRTWIDLTRVARWLAAVRFKFAVLALVSTPVVAAGVLRLSFDGDMSKLSSLSAATAADERAIEDTWGSALRPTSLAIVADDLQAALEQNDRLAERLAAWHADGLIGPFASVAGVLPARSTQLARARVWRSYWDVRRAAVDAALAQATERTPFRSGAFQPFSDWLRSDGQPYTLTELEQQGAAGLLRDRVRRTGDQWTVLTPVFATGWEQAAALQERIEDEFPDVLFINRQAFVNRVTGLVSDEIGRLGLLAFLLVTLAVGLWMGRLDLTLVVVAPLLVSLVWALGVLGWFGIPLTLVNSIFVVFIFGVAVDYAIFLAMSHVETLQTGRSSQLEAEAGVLLCGFTTCAAFGSLALARHPAMNSIGQTALIGIVVSALATLLFVPLLARVLVVRGLPGAVQGARLRVLRGRARAVSEQAQQRDPREQLRAAARALDDLCVQSVERVGFDQVADLDVLLYERAAAAGGLLPWVAADRLRVFEAAEERELPLFEVRQAAGCFAALTDEALAQARASGCVVAVCIDPGVAPELERVLRSARESQARVGVVVQSGSQSQGRVPWWLDAGPLRERVVVLSECSCAAVQRAFETRRSDQRMLRAESAARSNVGDLFRYSGPLAAHYAASKVRRDPLVDGLPALCDGDGPIAVLGCGIGVMTARLGLAFPGRSIRALDSDPRKVELARQALRDLPHVELVVGDLRDADLGCPAWVLLADVLHYWDEATQAQLLSSIAARIEPGTRLVFRDGCADHQRSHWLTALFERISILTGFTRGHGRFHFHTRAGWRRLLTEAGFVVDEVRPELGVLSNVVLVCHLERNDDA